MDRFSKGLIEKFFQYKDLPSYKNIPAFVLGNGPSRLQFDINELKHRGIIFYSNLFFKHIDLGNAPGFLNVADGWVYTKIFRTKYLDKHYLIFPPACFDVVFTKIFDQKYLKKMIPFPHDWKNAGHGAMNIAAHLGCFPIFLLGIGDPLLTVQTEAGEIYTDSVYGRMGDPVHKATNLRLYTNHEVMREMPKLRIWRRHFLEAHKKYPHTFYRVAGSGTNLPEIPEVEWDDILVSFPKRYDMEGVKVISRV